jgi:dipeptidyl aminopeptidase/acylaminoacyl peptidase
MMLPAYSQRPAEPADCVTVRYLSQEFYHPTIQISPKGDMVSYEVKAPNLETDTNLILLYVAHVRDGYAQGPQLVISGTGLSGVRWLPDNRHLMALIKDGNRVVLVQIDSVTRERKDVVRENADISEFALDLEAKTIVFATDDPPVETPAPPNPDQTASGYRIAFHHDISASWQEPTRELFVTRLEKGRTWGKPQQVVIMSPFSNHEVKAFPHVRTSYLKLGLSPDGKRLLLTYTTNDELPQAWRQSKAARKIFDPGIPTSIMVLYDLTTGKTTMPLPTYLPLNTPLWSSDSRSFVSIAMSPVGSEWEKAELIKPTELGHLFWVEPATGRIELVSSHVANTAEQPLHWDTNGDLMIHEASKRIVLRTHQQGSWSEKSSVNIPLDRFFRFAQLASDGKMIVGDYQNTTTPPELFSYKPGSKTVQTIAKLNPQLDDVRLASAESLSWHTSTGAPIIGTLLRPPDYVAGKRYPLLIQENADHGQFLCDTGITHYPSFAPQPIADSGILYLMRTYAEGEADHDDTYYPEGYPGGIGEAAFHMDIWDSAIDVLDTKGWIDRNRLGIIGFSRSGWYTEFILAHSKNTFKAATVTDNVQYNLSEYWMDGDGSIPGFDAMYDGPPYGQSLQNWMKYSISFNLDRIRTPLLMEVMGYKKSQNNPATIPALAQYDEVFTGLNRLRKPVELYFYPNEGHQPEGPRARLASLQRNLDWYRFWLQGTERDDPEDKNRYGRWREFRDLESSK